MDNHKLDAIILKITQNIHTDADISSLRQILSEYKNEALTQLGKYNVNIGNGKDIHIGDHTYYSWDDNAIQALVRAIREVSWQCVAILTENDYTQSTGIGLIDKLAKQFTDFSQQSVMRYGLKLAFSPNCGEYFVSAAYQVIKCWQTNKQKLLEEHPVPNPLDIFTSVAISPNAKLIASCTQYQIQIWQLNKEKSLYTFDKTWFSNFFDVFGFDSVTFSPDGKILAANDNQNIKLWNMETGKEVATLSGHSDKVTCIAFSPGNGRILASCSYDKTIKLSDIETKRCLGTLKDHRDSIYTLAFSPNGEILASGSNDNTIRFWNLNTGEMPKTLRHHFDGVTCLVFHPNGKSLFSGSNDKAIAEWTIEGEILSVFPEQIEQIFNRIEQKQQTLEDIEVLRHSLLAGDRQIAKQLGKYNVNIEQGQDIHIGDRQYYTWNEKALKALINLIQFGDVDEGNVLVTQLNNARLYGEEGDR
ncbi:MAG: hypothetical protein QNJ70_32190 [Xenococcaceae cyanobacterium MO_207.B15]|nr:hypothetical protein [Xenococcaceae cyanobacterium MO_207.B15]